MPTNREVSISGGYQPFQLKRDYHLDIFGNAVDKITQQHEKALEQRAAIQSALANIKLNEAETEWKQNYIDNITKQIDNAAQFGNYSSALTTATKLAGEAASNPELLAKVQENENYETWKKTLDSLYLNNKIDKNTRDYFKDKTKYSFNGTYDDNGNFKTYSLTEYENPVQQIDLSGLFSWVGQTVAEQSGSSQGVGARTATGSKTEYYSPDAAVLSHSGQGYSRKDLATINAVWDEAIKRHHEAIAYLQQQMDVNQWLLDKTEAELNNPNLDRNSRIKLESERDRLRNDLYVDGDESKPYTTQEYLYNSSKKTLEAMSYNRINTTFNVSDGGGSGRGVGYRNQGGGFMDINFNPVNRGPSGLIDRAVMNFLNTKVANGDDISVAVGQQKKR